ncbi:SLATT domain-containing protein [Nocardia transvalensis]|uniref:SLATT domain-containing protein n=1 Tax=Nocardia transvalensis TaxID=37333 RepID=UPI001893C9C3|nr:SLATT domain-containing protein [Nocardia transvalensis]MBF6329195.1 SLATT domain-containing protein [Nocardia transvalensis]
MFHPNSQETSLGTGLIGYFVSMRGWFHRGQGRSRSTGLRSPSAPPADADALGIGLYYLGFYRDEYDRSRLVVKSRAERVVVWTAVANGLIAVLGTAIAVFSAPWLGLVSTGLAASIGVLAAWDGMYRHREMWVQRSVILGQLQALLRNIELRQAQGEDRNVLARETMLHLNAILEEELEAWTALRRTQPASREREDSSGE